MEQQALEDECAQWFSWSVGRHMLISLMENKNILFDNQDTKTTNIIKIHMHFNFLEHVRK